MCTVLLLTITLGVVAGQFGFQPYNYYLRQPYGYQPYSQYGNYYRPPSPVPSPFAYRPPTPIQSPVTQTSNNLGTLPMGMYDNFVCNKIAGRTRKKRDAVFPEFTQSPGLVAYQQLYSFVDSSEHNQIWAQTNFLAHQGHTAATIVKLITSQRMQRDGEKGNMNDIYNAMTFLSSSSRSLVQETQKRAGAAVCTTTNVFYCNYINKLRTSAPYCSGAVLSNQLYQQCCTNQYSTAASTPVPSPFTAQTNQVPSPFAAIAAPTAPTFPTTPTFTSTPTLPNTTTGTSSQANCGISNKNPATRMGEFSNSMNQMRIVGGVRTEQCEYPWMVRLRMGNAMCGGSVIDNYHIVTAAHCVGSNTPATIGVHAGEYDYNNPYETNDQAVRAAAIIRHPNYRELPNGEQENDIAIIKLAQPLQFNECVQPVCLANDGDGRALAPGTQCTTAGWGTTSTGGQASPILQETTIPTYNGFDCNRVFSRTVPSDPNTQLCAGRPVIGGADTCQGDSGGPLFCPVNGRYVQYGIVSYGAGCAAAGAAGVYTDVGKMQGFISSVVNNQVGK